MKRFIRLWVVGCISLFVGLSACKKDEKFNLFTIDEDMQFGQQMDSTIQASPKEYPILDPVKYKAAYDYMNSIRDKILATGKIKYKDKFAWKITLIDTTILNAFATPGGYMYFYTGLVKFCDSEAELSGVLAHEMTHADKRHSTVNMTKTYSYGTLFQILLGKDNETLTKIATNLVSLKFSREQEYEADKNAVDDIAAVGYKGDAFKNFFVKMDSLKSKGFNPEFLSTHPSDDNRIEKITEEWNAVKTADSVYSKIGDINAVKNSLP
jgi:beta-barrel assembly-enhancing protease